jgi:hypothetical protein
VLALALALCSIRLAVNSVPQIGRTTMAKKKAKAKPAKKKKAKGKKK